MRTSMNRTQVINYVSSLPVGEYRQVLGAIRRAWKSRQTGKPVKRLYRRVRLDAKRVRWSHDVRDRDGWTCRKCGASKLGGAVIEGAHIVPATYPKLKYDILNGVALCGPVQFQKGCHGYFETHKNEWYAWVLDNIDLKVLAHLRITCPSWAGWNGLFTPKATP